MASPSGVRIGRPSKVDGRGRPTRERLLAAAAAACIEQGFEGTTLADIASRADVSTPAIYNHFNGKSDLMVQACKRTLSKMTPAETLDQTPRALVDQYLSEQFADERILQLEIHLAASRHPEVHALLAQWQDDHASYWTAAGYSLATIKAWYSLLLGLAQLEALSSLDVADEDFLERAHAMADALFRLDGV